MGQVRAKYGVAKQNSNASEGCAASDGRAAPQGAAVIGGWRAVTLAALTLCGGWVWAAEVGCDTGVFALRSDYPGARMSGCEVVSRHEVRVTVNPEDGGRINPSPWYGFHARRLAPPAGAPRALAVRLEYGVHKHRYAPKVSVDGVRWRRLQAEAVRLVGAGALLRLCLDERGLFVSAGELLTEDYYAAWRGRVGAAAGAEWAVIGKSVDGRAIHALLVNAEAPNYLLLLGRQHPPEVTGALALTRFAERLLATRRACAEAAAEVGAADSARSPRCRFLANHGVVVVPNLNPDGVAGGHWRHNRGQTDLNRDWGRFSQPETQAVRDLVAGFERAWRRPRLVLDFHSTRRNVFYTQDDASPTRPARFAERWLAAARRRGGLYAFENAPRPLTELGTAKNYFHRRFGVPSITYEVADEADRTVLAHSAAAFADAMVEVLAEVDATPPPGCEDFHCHMAEANAASLIMLAEEGLLGPEQAARTAAATAWVVEEQARPGAARTANYLPFEDRLIALAGVAAANVHMGRSRQDLHGTTRRMMARQEWLAILAALLDARGAALALADREAHTPVPAYTHGVQAQPTTFGHLLLGFSAALRRDAERLVEGYRRVNRSPLGAAALGTSGFALNRHRLAELLGFAAPLANSYDANLIASADYRLELAGTLTASAVAIGQFAENLHTQYHNPRPWIVLAPAVTSGSSIMPQKRNPRPLDRLRSTASAVIARAQQIVLLAHNTNTGMHDYRQAEPLLALTAAGKNMYRRYAALLRAIGVDAARAAEELARGYSTMTEVADMLLREAGVPFRTAHAYARALVEHCRAEELRAVDLSDREIKRIYHAVTGVRLPVAAATVRRVMDPSALIAGRRGFGGPQPAEMERGLAAHAANLAEQRAWLATAEAGVTAARATLATAFGALAEAGLPAPPTAPGVAGARR